MVVSLRSPVMARFSCLLTLPFGGLAPCSALLTPSLSAFAPSLFSCLQVTSVAAMMLWYEIRLGVTVNLRPSDRTSVCSSVRFLLLRFFTTFYGSSLGVKCSLSINLSNLCFCLALFCALNPNQLTKVFMTETSWKLLKFYCAMPSLGNTTDYSYSCTVK